jgi:uncharacterized protein YprB with RNaseH-like and TPR domain
MDSSTLADRIRAIVGPRSAGIGAERDPAPIPADPFAPAEHAARLHGVEQVLGGEWRAGAGASCFIVERRRDRASSYGDETVGALADRLQAAAAEAPLVAGGAQARLPFVFVDLETTGLSGGAGTYAFLVGCGWCDEDGGFVTRQFMLTRFADERALLSALTAELAGAGALVSFNGKSFDAPVLETRYLFHRLQSPGSGLPHLDVLHPARRFWRDEQEVSTCSLVSLERQILGARRVGDVPGFEIPGRYFHFIRSGDARPLAPVLEHNRLDLLSLAGLTARLLHLVRGGPGAARNARETLALGRVYARAGLEARARDAFQRAADRASTSGAIQVDSLRALALAWRRARRYDDAAGCWRAVLDAPACPRHVAREATEALAIHHEHRVRDLAAARAFALRSLESGTRPASHAAVRHRLARIERKMGSPRLFAV